MDVTLIVLSSGDSRRFNYIVKKQWIRIGDDPLWLFVTNRLSKFYNFKDIIITANKYEIPFYKNYSDYKIVEGDNTRQKSLKNALNYVQTDYVLVTDVARACIDKTTIDALFKNIYDFDIVVPYLNVVDTAVYKNKTINREELKLIQTPQLSKTTILKKALSQEENFTDERGAIESIGGKINYVKGSPKNKKITYFEDLDLDCLKAPSSNIFNGIGYDSHRFEYNKPMYLGGIKIDVDYGFKAHSDGDVLIHSIIDALLGAASYSDIGELFPDNKSEFKNIDSMKLLKEVKNILEKTGFEIINIDATIIAEQPSLKAYKNKIQRNLSNFLNCRVNIKASTNEKMGFIGRKEGIAVLSNATLKYKEWYEDFNSRK